MTFYRERLWPSAWLFISTALVIPASLLVFLPINLTAGVIVAIVLYGGCVGALIASSPVLEISSDELRAGRARLPLDFIGELTAHSGADATMQRGQQLDARAWLLIRGWISPVARVEVTDPDDPTPYWLISTRHPDAFIAAITQRKIQG